MIVDPTDRSVVANAPGSGLQRSGNVYVGTLPAELTVANTAIDWNGTRWTEALWPLPEDPVERNVLLLHEAFHRIQSDVGLPGGREGGNGHLDTADGRYWLLLELRALARAISAQTGDRQAIADALAFRAARHRRFPNAAAEERDLERHEGIAEYTGRVLAASHDGKSLAGPLAAAGSRPSLVRSFAYLTGPAYGLLLDRAAPHWRSDLAAGLGPAEILAVKLRLQPASNAKARARAYAGESLRATEDKRERDRLARTAELRAGLVDGPVTVIPFEQMQIEFDPNRTFALEGAGTVYQTMRISDAWGKLTVDGEALVASDWQSARLPGPARQTGTRLEGPGWRIELRPGWELAVGARNGDQTLRRSPQGPAKPQ